MAASKGGGGGQSDNSAGILWGIAAIFAVVGVLWYVLKSYIVYGYFLIKLYEVDLLNLVTNDRYEALHRTILAALAHPQNVGFSDLITIGSEVGAWIRYPFALLLFILAIIVYLGNTTRVFRRIYSIKELAKAEKVNWPQIMPVVDLDLIKVDIDTGPWAMAMTPMQFCKRHRLLDEVKPQRREGMSRKDWDRIEVVLRRGEATKLFALQLGNLWRGVDKLPPHTKALFAVFAARINADSKPAADLLRQMNISCTGKLDFTGTDELLKKHANTKLVQEIVKAHAYVYTVMASMLEAARLDGVQASADFLWLKPFDRRLWYVLNVVGRQTPFVEVGGVFAHWVAEKEAGRKLILPMVEEASKALEGALKEVIYRPDEVK
jgi:intracellular multiplication protein IcmP